MTDTIIQDYCEWKRERDIRENDSPMHPKEVWQAAHARYAPRECQWLQDDFDGSWDTSCGNKYEIISGTPEENGMKFCAYCGGHLIATKEPQ